MKNLSVLMIEDDKEDQYITSATIKEAGIDIPFHFSDTGEDAFQWLGQQKQLPSLIILDKNLPAVEGIDILKELKQHPVYNIIPVVIVSGSAWPEEIAACYAAGASSYIQKPSSGTGTDKKILNFLQYWFETCELPVISVTPA
jgi:CheY-like chemotaxis protein